MFTKLQSSSIAIGTKLPSSSIAVSIAISMIWLVLSTLFVIVLVSLVKFWFTRVPLCLGGKLKPRIEEVLGNMNTIKYNLHDFSNPTLTGWKFQLLVWLFYTRFGQYIMWPFIVKSDDMRMDSMGKVQIPECPTYYPVPPTYSSTEDHTKSNKEVLETLIEKEMANAPLQFRLPTVCDFLRAYRSGETTPTDVAKAVLAAIADSDKATPPLRAIVQTDESVVLAMAEASTQRWKDGKALSLIDGVPVAIKEEFNCKPYKLRAGASYTPILSEGVPESTIVLKLKDAGAVIIGVANMHEFAAGSLGSNPHPPQLTARNPYDPQRYPGGSSSGSAVSVAAGFCPIAIGSDGGGSIRIPATLCGTVGLMPTFGLLDTLGMLPSSFTVGAAGPLTSSVLDTAIAMSIIAQERDSNCTLTSLEGLGEGRVDGLKVGVYWDLFNHADKEIVSKCKAALSHLQELGAELIEIKIPEFDDNSTAHGISISVEFSNSLSLDIDQHYSQFNPETHIMTGLCKNFSAIEYINAQRQRTRAIKSLKFIFDKVDIIVTPGTPIVAPPIKPEAIDLGIMDTKNTVDLTRFCLLGNFTGIPGLVLPVGYTVSGLPVSLQLMAPWYQDNILLKVGWALEQSGAFPTRKPQVFYDVISKSAAKNYAEH